jgi:hypothetical protein
MFLPALGGQLGGDEAGEVAYGVELFKFGSLELDFETRLNGDDQVDVVEGVPFRDLRGGEFGSEDEGIVIEKIVKDGGELVVDVLRLHG